MKDKISDISVNQGWLDGESETAEIILIKTLRHEYWIV